MMFLARLNVAYQASSDSEQKLLNFGIGQQIFGKNEPRLGKLIYDSKEPAVWLSPWQLRVILNYLRSAPITPATRRLEDLFSTTDFAELVISLNELAQVGDQFHGFKLFRDLHIEQNLRRTGYAPVTDEFAVMQIREEIVQALLTDKELENGFYEINGVTPLQHYTALLALWSFYFSYDINNFKNQSPFAINLPSRLGLCGLGKQVGDYVLKNLSCELPEIEASDIDEGHCSEVNFFDTSELSLRPFVFKSPDTLIALDLDYTFSRVVDGLWHQVRFASKHAGITQFSERYGKVFQNHIEQILHQCSEQGDGKWAFFGEKDLTDDIPLDALCIFGDVVVCFEIKAGALPTKILYDPNPKTLAFEIDKLVVTGTERKPKGLAQLRNHIQRLVDSRSSHIRGARHIVPCLVVEDSTYTSAPIRNYIKTTGGARLRQIQNVTDPVVIDASDLQLIKQRSRWISPGILFQELARSSAWSDLSSRNAILRIVPLKSLTRFGQAVTTQSSMPFYDMALSEIESRRLSDGSALCPKCKKIPLCRTESDICCAECGAELIPIDQSLSLIEKGLFLYEYF